MVHLAGVSMIGPPPGPLVPFVRPPGRTIPVPTGGASQPFREQGELFPLWRSEEVSEPNEARDGED